MEKGAGRTWLDNGGEVGGFGGGGGRREGGGKDRAEVEEETITGKQPRQGDGSNCHRAGGAKSAHISKIARTANPDTSRSTKKSVFHSRCETISSARSSAGIYPLHLELTKCQLAGSFPARCEHAARGRPPVIDLTDRVDFHGVCVCYIQAPLSPCCTGVDIYETCRRGPLDRTNERARPAGELRSLTLPSSGPRWYCSSEVRWGHP